MNLILEKGGDFITRRGWADSYFTSDADCENYLHIGGDIYLDMAQDILSSLRYPTYYCGHIYSSIECKSYGENGCVVNDTIETDLLLTISLIRNNGQSDYHEPVVGATTIWHELIATNSEGEEIETDFDIETLERTIVSLYE